MSNRLHFERGDRRKPVPFVTRVTNDGTILEPVVYSDGKRSTLWL
jgi:hypothetical protein